MCVQTELLTVNECIDAWERLSNRNETVLFLLQFNYTYQKYENNYFYQDLFKIQKEFEAEVKLKGL